MNRKKSIIKLAGIGKVYHSGSLIYRALSDVSLEVFQGEYVAIVGPSGSGKSTCMNIIGLLDDFDEGRYFLEGEDVSFLSEEEKARYRNRFIGFVFQSFNLLSNLSLLDNVALPLLYANVPEKLRRDMAREALENVGLGAYLHHRPTELSGGQKQRGAIARALINHPPLILADEPTGNLDSHSAQEILQLFDNLVAEGNTIVLITHDSIAAERAQRCLRISDGKILSDHDLQSSGRDQSFTK